MENNKIYKELPNLSNYLICTDGNVYRKSDNGVMKGTLNHGSRSVILKDDNKTSVTFHLGKLVAESFGLLYPYTGIAWIRYKDNNRLNTALDNLYWEGNFTGLVGESEKALFKPHHKYDNVLSSEDGRICDNKWQLYKLLVRNNAVCIIVYSTEEAPQQKGAKKYNTINAAQIIATTWLNYPQGSKDWGTSHVDGNVFNLAASNIRITASLVSPDELHLFRPVPTYPDTSVSACGRVINHKNMLEYTTDCKNINAYNTVHIKRPDGKTGKVSVHRLVAMVWLDRPDNYLELEVNHINGIKHDNRVENLEWVTSSGNKQHSVRTDLANSNMPCILVDKGELLRFKSRADASRYLKYVIPSTERVKDEILGLELITYPDKDTPVTTSTGVIVIPSILPFKLFSQTVVAYNIITEEVSIYDNAGKAGRFLGIDSDSLSQRATTESKWPYMNYLFRWTEGLESSPFRKFTAEEIVAFKDKAVTRPVRATLSNGETKLCAGAKEVREYFNIKQGSLQYYINNKKQYTGISFEYLK